MRRIFAVAALALGVAFAGAAAEAGLRSYHPHPGYHGRSAGFWGYGNYIGRHHRFGPFATPGGYPRNQDPYVRRGSRH